MDFDFGTYYESLTPTHRMDEELIVSKAMEEGVIPDVVRFGLTRGVYRGMIKSLDKKFYYFNFSPDTGNIRIVEATSPDQLHEVSGMYKSCPLGCDLRKAGQGGGGQQGSGGLNTVAEDADINHQEELTTERHPGAATHVTPDDPSRGRMWHEQEVPPMAKSLNAGFLLNGMNESLTKSTSQLRPVVSDQEKQFMVEILGRTPDQVSRGDSYLNPTQRVMFNQWVSKSMRSTLGVLDKWLKK